MEEIRRVKVEVTGRVQGVGYRAWVLSRANALELQGWVKNMDDGSVEAVFDGPANQVDQMLEDLWEGPRGSKVTGVSVSVEHQNGALSGFAIQR